MAVLALAGVGPLADAALAAQAPAAQAPAVPSPVPVPPAGASALPPGPGRDVVMRVCSACHSPEIIATQRHDAQGWAEVVQLMASRGANANEDEFNEIIDYLANSFPAQSSTPSPAQGAHPPFT
jgi:competence protein ComEA